MNSDLLLSNRNKAYAKKANDISRSKCLLLLIDKVWQCFLTAAVVKIIEKFSQMSLFGFIRSLIWLHQFKHSSNF